MSYEPLPGQQDRFGNRTLSSPVSFAAEQRIQNKDPESEEQRLLKDEENASPKRPRQPASLCSPSSTWWKSCASSMGPLQQAYLALLALQGVFVVGLLTATVDVVAHRAEAWGVGSLKDLYLYLAIFISAEMYQLLLAVEAVKGRNTPQLYATTSISILMLIYAALLPRLLRQGLSNTYLSECYRVGNTNASCRDFEGSSVYQAVKGLVVAAPVSIGLTTCLAVAVLRQIQAQWGRSACKQSGPSTQHLYQQCLLTAIKLDLFFFVVFVIQLVLFGLFVRGVEDLEFDYTIMLLLPIIASCTLGIVSVQRASLRGFFAFVISHMLISAYFTRKLWNIFAYQDEHGFNPYEQHQASLALFAISALLCAAGTLFLVMRVYLHQRAARRSV